MNEALWRARRGALVLGCVFLFSIAAYHNWFDKPLLESIYWTVISISGVGYSQALEPGVGEARQFLSIVVILFGMLSMAYTVGMLIQAIVEGQLDKALGAQKLTKEIAKLKDHVIICGYGRIGQNLAHRLARHRVPFVIVDPKAEVVAEARALGYLIVEGDSTDEAILHQVGLERAATIVVAMSSDADNVFLTLTVRNLNPKINIMARGEHPRTEKKLLQAGANQVVLPAVIGAERMADIIIRPEDSELLRSVGRESGLNAELEEFKLAADSGGVGRSVAEAEATQSAMIVAVRRADGETLFNPRGDELLRAGDIVIVMGPEADIEEFYCHTVAANAEPTLVC